MQAIEDNVTRSPPPWLGCSDSPTARPVREGLVAESHAYSMLLGGSEFAAWRCSRAGREMPAFYEPAILLERIGDRLDVTLNRSRRHNAFRAEVCEGLLEALAVGSADDSVECVELRGNGRLFCSGGDLESVARRRTSSPLTCTAPASVLGSSSPPPPAA